MSGYQEVITDASYAGQVVVMTYPLIGNYGCRDDTAESSRVQCRALVVRELSADIGHARGERTVEAHVTQILLKLGLAESPDQHRRVLAVLTFLRA